MAIFWKPVSKSVLVIGGIGALAFLSHALASQSGFLVLDYVNLPVHEAGHMIFGLFGEKLGIWGGTLMQILIPALFTVYFYQRRETPGTAFSAFWVGENLLNIARYIADARVQELPLVGGGEHDWNLILSDLRLLQHDLQIAEAVRFLGWIIMILAVAWFIRQGLRSRGTQNIS
jgi:hypothetical protein